MTSDNVFIMTQPEKPKNDPVYNFKASCTSLAEQISENRIIEAKSIEDLTNSLGRLSLRILQACSHHKRPVLNSRPYFGLFVFQRGIRSNLKRLIYVSLKRPKRIITSRV